MRVVGTGEEEVAAGEGLRRLRAPQAALELRRREPLGVAEDDRLRVVVDGERLVGQLAREAHAEELRRRGERPDERVAEVAGEEEPEEPVGVGEAVLRLRDRAVEPLRLEDEDVSRGEPVREEPRLLGAVGLVERQLDDAEPLGRTVGEGEGEALVPVLR